MTHRTIVISTLVMAVILLTMGRVGAAPEVSQVEFGVSKSPQLSAQIVVALERGYFEREGIKPNIKWTPSGREFAEAFAARAVMMGTSGEQPAINLVSRGLPVRVFTQLSEMSASLAVVVKKEISKPVDLHGKKVAFFPGTTSELIFQTFTEKYRLDAGKMQQFHMDMAEMVAAFIRGDVDAIFAWEPIVTRAVQAGGKMLVTGARSFVPGQEGPHRMTPGHGVFSMQTEFATKNPQTVRAVLRALIAANEYLQDPANTPTVARWINTHTAMPADLVEVTMKGTKYQMQLDPQLVEDMQRTMDFMVGKKQIKTRLAAKDLYVVGPLREINPSLVVIKLE